VRGSGGFLLLLIGALGLIGFLSGNLDRWLAYLFSPSDTSPTVTGAVTAPTSTSTSTSSGDRRTA
jgi:hypothetical protein